MLTILTQTKHFQKKLKKHLINNFTALFQFTSKKIYVVELKKKAKTVKY